MVDRDSATPNPALTAAGDFAALAAGTRTVALWTLVGRLSGFARVVALGAVLGPTFFGNLVQILLFVPYVICELVAGSLITAMLAPSLVHALDRGDQRSAADLARGFLGVVLPAFSAVALIGMALAPVLLWLVTLPVAGPAVRAEQVALGLPLLLCLLPQVALYAIAGVGIAVQHAHRRFALATAAPMIENIGLIVVLGVYAAKFGVGADLDHVGLPQLLTLGLGSTAAVAAHAGAQWWGAYRLGIRLAPRAGWRDASVRRIVRMALPSSASAALNSVGLLAMLVASGHVAGGAVAFQIGQNFYNLPVALSARPIAAAQLPLLSRHFARGALGDFVATYRTSLRLAFFVAFPASLLFLGMPGALAAAVSFGTMASPAAMALVAAALAGLGVGIVGEALFVVSTSAAYAGLDARTPLRGMALRLLICLASIPLALAMTGPQALLTLGLGYSAGSLAASAYLWSSLRRLAPGAADDRYWPLRNALAAIIATAPAAFLASGWGAGGAGFTGRLALAAALVALSIALYLLVQAGLRSAELRALLGPVAGGWQRLGRFRWSAK